MFVSSKKFKLYEAVRQSGVTNMFDVKYVCELSEQIAEDFDGEFTTDDVLTRDDVFYIMKHYNELYKEYLK